MSCAVYESSTTIFSWFGNRIRVKNWLNSIELFDMQRKIGQMYDSLVQICFFLVLHYRNIIQKLKLQLPKIRECVRISISIIIVQKNCEIVQSYFINVALEIFYVIRRNLIIIRTYTRFFEFNYFDRTYEHHRKYCIVYWSDYRTFSTFFGNW